MADWAQVLTQVFVTPVAAAVSTAIAAGVVVRKQALAHERVAAKAEMREQIGQVRREARIWITKRQYTSTDVIDVYYRGYLECSALVSQADLLGMFRRKMFLRLCKKLYGSRTFNLATKIPHDRTEIDEIVDKIQYSLTDGEHAIATTYTKGHVIGEIFDGDLRFLFVDDNNTSAGLIDEKGRGVVNIFRLNSETAKIYGARTKDRMAEEMVRIAGKMIKIG